MRIVSHSGYMLQISWHISDRGWSITALSIQVSLLSFWQFGMVEIEIGGAWQASLIGSPGAKRQWRRN
jgi:hypothetical protein